MFTVTFDVELITQYPPIACGSEVGVKVQSGGDAHLVVNAWLAEVESEMVTCPLSSPLVLVRATPTGAPAGAVTAVEGDKGPRLVEPVAAKVGATTPPQLSVSDRI